MSKYTLFLKKLNYEEIQLIKSILLSIDDKMLDSIIKSSIEDCNFYLNELTIDTNINSISDESIHNMDYKELNSFINFLICINDNELDNDYLLSELHLAKRLREFKRDLVVKGIIRLNEMNLEEYQILLDNMGNSGKDWYSVACGVEEDDLTADILYKKYHSKGLRRIR